jgi:hypothetical protein
LGVRAFAVHDGLGILIAAVDALNLRRGRRLAVSAHVTRR